MMKAKTKSMAEPAETARPKLRTDFFRLDDQTFAGYVVDEDDLNRRFVVEFMLDGYPYQDCPCRRLCQRACDRKSSAMLVMDSRSTFPSRRSTKAQSLRFGWRIPTSQ